jgi:AcrR family transcriptional regulator
MSKKATPLIAREKRSRVPSPEADAGYHHGDLQEALISATEAILADQGAEGFTLREAARRAGVSPAAPSHHFGNAPGLLTEVAIRGYDELGAALRQAGSGKGTLRERMHAQGIAYVEFALKYPGRFQMMFSNKRLVSDDERLRKAVKSAHREFEILVERFVAEEGGGKPRQAKIVSTVAWSTVHGFAKLALEGKFGGVGTEAGRREMMATLREVLDYLWPLDRVRPAR